MVSWKSWDSAFSTRHVRFSHVSILTILLNVCMCACACACVCVTETETERDRERQRDFFSGLTGIVRVGLVISWRAAWWHVKW